MDIGFFAAALAGGGVTSILLGIAGYLGRSQLSHWLNKDIERIKTEFQRELQIEKATLERELEAYKVFLIAEAEKVKAAQSIKTAGALRMMELKFDALTGLFKAIREYTSNSISYCTLVFPNFEIYVSQRTQITEKMMNAAAAIENAAPFIPHTEYRQLLNLHNALIRGIGERVGADAPMPAARVAQFSEQVIPMQVAANTIMQAHITSMLQVA